MEHLASRNSSLAESVAVRPAYRIYRDTGIALTRPGDAHPWRSSLPRSWLQRTGHASSPNGAGPHPMPDNAGLPIVELLRRAGTLNRSGLTDGERLRGLLSLDRCSLDMADTGLGRIGRIVASVLLSPRASRSRPWRGRASTWAGLRLSQGSEAGQQRHHERHQSCSFPHPYCPPYVAPADRWEMRPKQASNVWRSRRWHAWRRIPGSL